MRNRRYVAINTGSDGKKGDLYRLDSFVPTSSWAVYNENGVQAGLVNAGACLLFPGGGSKLCGELNEEERLIFDSLEAPTASSEYGEKDAHGFAIWCPIVLAYTAWNCHNYVSIVLRNETGSLLAASNSEEVCELFEVILDCSDEELYESTRIRFTIAPVCSPHDASYEYLL